MNILYLILILNSIYFINGFQINSYTINNNNLIINGDGFTFQTLVKFKYQDLLTIPTFINENEIQITLPYSIENCEFYAFNNENEISNSLYLTLNPIISSFGNTFDDEGSKLNLIWYGQYIWGNRDINQYNIEISDDSNTKIECNEIKNISISLEDQMIQCSIKIQEFINIKSTFKANITIGQQSFYLIDEYSITIPSINNITQKDSSIIINSKNLGSGIQLLDSLLNSIKVYANDKEISSDCKNLVIKNNDGNLECYFGSVIKEINFNDSLNIKINSRNFNSNQINLDIKPFIYTNEIIKIYPLGQQNILLNYYYPKKFNNNSNNNNDDIKVYLIMNQRNGECQNIEIINPNQLSCTLSDLFISIYLSIKISINNIETNSVSIFSYLEPKLESIEKLNNNQIKINGNNLIPKASLSYSFKPLNCTLANNSLLCTLNECNQTNCFSSCGIIIYNDYSFSTTINYYPSPIIYSANFYNDYLIINASIDCSLITPQNYFESDIFVYINGIRTSFTLFESGLFKFLYEYPSTQLDLFDIIFSVKGVNSTFQYNRLFDSPPTIFSSKLIDNKIIIDGFGLTENAIITYLDEELSCISTKNTGDYFSYRLECQLLSKINLNSTNHCGILNYNDKYLKTSFIFLVEPTIYNVEATKKINKFTGESYLSYIDINGTINCDDIPIQHYNNLNLMVKFDNKNVPFNYYKEDGLFRFNFVNKQLPIPDKPNIQIYFSNSYYELNSNILKINNSQIQLDNSSSNTIKANNTSKLTQSNILISIFMIILIIITIFK